MPHWDRVVTATSRRSRKMQNAEMQSGRGRGISNAVASSVDGPDGNERRATTCSLSMHKGNTIARRSKAHWDSRQFAGLIQCQKKLCESAQRSPCERCGCRWHLHRVCTAFSEVSRRVDPKAFLSHPSAFVCLSCSMRTLPVTSSISIKRRQRIVSVEKAYFARYWSRESADNRQGREKHHRTAWKLRSNTLAAVRTS